MTEDGSRKQFVSNYLLYLLAASSEAASASFHETIRERGVRVPEWRALACLVDEDGLMVTQLADFALLEQSRMTRIIAQMEARGLVSRRSDRADGRRVRVFLTDTGRTLAEELVAAARAHERRLFEALPDGSEDVLKPALISLLHHLGKEDD